MAELFVLRADRDGQRVVLKRLLPNASPQVEKLFLREAEALAALDSPHVVGYVDSGPGHLLVDYVDGCDLATLMQHLGRRGQRLPAEAALRLVDDVLAGIEALHEAGLIHRDLNPRNVMVGRDGRARIIDLGIVKRPGLGESTVDGLKGTLAYMAPEQLIGAEVSPATDLYAVGLLAYELVTGMSLAPARASVSDLTALRTQVPQSPSMFGAPAALDAPILQALNPEVAGRWPSARGFRDALEIGPDSAARESVGEAVAAAVGAQQPLELPLGMEGGGGTQLATSPAQARTEVADAPDAGTWNRLLVVTLVAGLVLGGVLLGWLVGKNDEAQTTASVVDTPGDERRRPGRRRGGRQAADGAALQVEVSSLGSTPWTLETGASGRLTTPATLRVPNARPTVVRVLGGGDTLAGVLRLRRQGRRLLVSGRRGLDCGRKRIALTPGVAVECSVNGKPVLKVRRP